MADSTLHCMRFTSIVAPLPILLSFAFIFITATSQRQINISLGASLTPSQRQINISLGASLTPSSTNSWLSPSGLFAFGFYRTDRGYWVGVTLGGTVVWTANRNNPPVPSRSTLLFTNDGRLVLQSTGAQDTLVANASEKAVLASFSDAGNFVLYNSRGDKIWQSFHSPTDTLLAGQNLLPGHRLLSSVSDSDTLIGIFCLDMQTTGNLVQYPIDSPLNYYWSSDTFGLSDSATLNLDNDGSLYLSNRAGEILKNITRSRGPPKEGILYLMRLAVDGILRLYSYNGTRKNLAAEWSSSNNKCSPGGVCGFNMFCVMVDQNAECECLPGFVPVNKGDWRSGCKRKFTAQTCEETNPLPGYNIESVNNTVWENTAYDSLTSLTEKECQEACLRDCNCEAVIYKDGNCGKQRLPLRYGRRDPDESNTLYVKVGGGNGTKVDVGGGGNGTKGSEQKHTRRDILIAVASSIAFAIVMLAVSVIIVHRNRFWVYERSPKEVFLTTIEDVAPTSYTFEDLKKVTGNFSEEIGRGAFGTVYKGTLMKNEHSSKAVAVKKLKEISSDGEREFLAEVKTIGKTHHRNLVRLLGYCHDGENRLLVYEYMSNGSLADVLFKAEHQASWDVKMGIAQNVARGLLYLHEECETQIIHCDIKPQNILIDDNMQAKIADFGLSKLLKPDQTNTTTTIRGTRGYVALEWHKQLRVTVKADTYSFGVVLLEIICGRRCVDSNLPEEEAVLEDWVYHCFQVGELDKLVHYQTIDPKQLERMVKVALLCVQEEPALRPSMRKVLLILEGTVDVPIPPCLTSFSSVI